MNWEIAKKAVDFFALRCIDTPNVGISFYGGEPLLEYDLIKKVILYCETRLKGKELSYNMTTNGTLLTEDMANFFVSKKVHLLISLDGPPDIHNRQRRFASDGTGTFDKIIKNVKQLSNSVPGFDNLLSFNTVIDPNNDIQAVNHFFQDSFFKSKSISPNDLVPPLGTQLIFPKSYQNTVRKQELLAFLAWHKVITRDELGIIAKKIFDQIHKEINTFSSRQELGERTYHSGPCIPGYHKTFVSCEGNIYPCEKCSETLPEMYLGNIFDGFDMKQIYNLFDLVDQCNSRCANCWAIASCTLCAAQMDGYSDDSSLLKCKAVRKNVEWKIKKLIALKETEELEVKYAKE